MQHYEEYEDVVAIGEKSAGNDSVGDMWLITKSFPKTATLEQVLLWAKRSGVSGKLILSIDEPEVI